MKTKALVLSALFCAFLSFPSHAQLKSANLSVGSDFQGEHAFYHREQSLVFAIPKDLRLTVGISKLSRRSEGPGDYCATCDFETLNKPFTEHRLDERLFSINALVGKSFELSQRHSLKIVGSAGPAILFHSKIKNFNPLTTTNSYSGEVSSIPNSYSSVRSNAWSAGLNLDLRLEWAAFHCLGLFVSTQSQINPVVSSYTLNAGLMVGKLKDKARP